MSVLAEAPFLLTYGEIHTKTGLLPILDKFWYDYINVYIKQVCGRTFKVRQIRNTVTLDVIGKLR